MSREATVSDRVYLRPDRSWTVADGVAVRGRAFVGEDPRSATGLRAGEDLCAQFADAATLEAFAARLDECNGFFAVVSERADRTLLGVDHVRSVPLLYAPERGFASDDASHLRDRLGTGAYDPLAESDLLVSGEVVGDRTLVPGMRALRPGEAVALAGGTVERTRYADYLPRTDGGVSDAGTDGGAATGRVDEASDAAVDGTRARLETAIDGAFDRLSAVAGDRQVALALSGGYDSRLVATELARRDHDVLAYSFGRPDAADVVAARGVAAALGLPWEFVEYSTEGWREWYASPERAAYVDAAFTYDAIPNYGTVPALSALVDRGALDADAVCSSGQTVVGMSENVPRQLDRPDPDVEDLVDAVVDYWGRWGWDDPAFDRAVRSRVRDAVPSAGVSTLPEAFAWYERWKWTERHTKYFVADVRQYDFLDRDWWLPLWDRAVVDAWAAVPFARRRGKQLYRSVVDDRFAAATGLDRPAATGLAAETRSPSVVERAVEAAAERLVDSPVAPYLRGLYWRFQRARSDYGDHPLGWYGVVPPELFARIYSGREDVHALQTLEAVGRASFVDGTVTDPPRDGVLAVPYDGGGPGERGDGRDGGDDPDGRGDGSNGGSA